MVLGMVLLASTIPKTITYNGKKDAYYIFEFIRISCKALVTIIYQASEGFGRMFQVLGTG
jgi:hypothetical protein